jgi:UDP-N-acetylmuramate dehydrogenase
MKIHQNHPLKELNWWKVGGSAQFFAAPESESDLVEALRFASSKSLAVHVISGGSNVLIQDGVIDGLVLSTHSLKGILSTEEKNGKLHIEAWAGTPKSEAAKVYLQKKLAPAVFLTGIPGDLGGGVVMNAGVGEARKPREFCEIVEWIEIFDLSPAANFAKRRIAAADLQWEYRNCSGYQPAVITKVGLVWANEPDPQVLQDVREATKKRVQTQPLNQPSCGSVFRNPPGHKSARLIEGAGLKGYSIGQAQVSTKHANFIVNLGQATASDVHALICHVRDTVKAQHGIDLHAEVKYIGTWN